jgi:hypothetical protein
MNSDNEIEKQVNGIFDVLFQEAKKSTRKTIAPDAEQWWRSHYRALFYRAIHFKQLKFEEARPMLTEKGRELMKEAEASAGESPTISREDAAVASTRIDCPDGKLEEWCN